MSPLPNPAPTRYALLRVLCSPTSLLLYFVVIVIVTCPGARGDNALHMLSPSQFFQSPIADLSRLEMQETATRSAPVVPRPTSFDRATVSLPRSPTPSERGGRIGVSEAPARPAGLARSALPLLSDPAIEPSARAASTGTIRPMTGPTVGVSSRVRLGR